MTTFFPQVKQTKTEGQGKTSDPSCAQQLEWLINMFVKNSYDIISQQYPDISLSKEAFQNEVSGDMANIVNKIAKQTLINKLIAGGFDEVIFSENVSIKNVAEELRTIMEIDNRSFMQRLFIKCTSAKVLNFWLDNGIKLPRDSVVTAVLLKSKKIVFEALYEKGWFKDMDVMVKENLLQKGANRLDEETFIYLKNILGANKPLNSL